MLLRAVYSSARMRSSAHAVRPPITASAVFPCGSHPTVHTDAGGETLLFPRACVASCGAASFSPVTQCVTRRTFLSLQTLPFAAATLLPPVPAHTVRAYSTADSSIGAGSTAAAGVDWSGVDLLRVLAYLNTPESPQRPREEPSSPAVKTEGDVAAFIAWAKALPQMQSDERPGGSGARFISPFKNWSNVMVAAHAEALVRAQFASGAFPKSIEEFLTDTNESERDEYFWNRLLLPSVYKLLPYRGVLPRPTLASIVASGSHKWKEACKLNDPWCDRVLVVRSSQKVWDRMLYRRVLVPAACADHHAALAPVGVKRNLVVVTGESGAGKTFSTVHRAATQSPTTFVLYFPSCHVEIAKKGDDETDIAYRQRRNNAMSDYLIASVRGQIGSDLPWDDKASAVIVLDEMGDNVEALRAICRLFVVKEDGTEAAAPPAEPLLIDRLAAIVGCTVRVVALGTGCDNEYITAGSMGVNPDVCRLLPAFGEQVWRELVAAAANKLDVNSLARQLFQEVCRAVAPALMPEEWKRTKQERQTPAPWGRVGTALVRNPRVAALILQSIEHQLKHPTSGPPILLTDDAWESNADLMAGVAIRTAVPQFAQLNGLQPLAPPARFGYVAAAAALHMNATDADLPDYLFRELCVQAGVTTLHTTKAMGDDYPVGARAVQSELHPRLCVEQQAALGPDALQLRYRVTPACVTLLTLGFGFAPRPPNEGLEAALLDYCVAAVTAAAVLWAWAAGPVKKLRPLAIKRAPAADVARNELFEAIRATMLFGAGQGAQGAGVGAAPALRPNPIEGAAVERGRSSVRFQPTVVDATCSITNWYCDQNGSDKGAAPGQSRTQTPVEKGPYACLLNAPAASGPDLGVFLRGAGSVLIQAKDAQTYTFERLRDGDEYSHRVVARQVVETLNEFVKMGSPAFDRESVLKCCRDERVRGFIKTELNQGNTDYFRTKPCHHGDACLGADSWCTYAHSWQTLREVKPAALCLHQTLAARAWKLVQNDDFPYTTFVVVRAFARAGPKGQVSSPALGIVNAILKDHHASEPIKKQAARFKCVYVETYHGDPLFDPVDVAARDDRTFRARFDVDYTAILTEPKGSK